MDLEAVKRLRRSLTLHFAVIACLTAMLVATGSQSYFLPVFIFCVSVTALVFVDWLEWFEIGRIGSYVGMLAATAFSMVTYFYNAFTVPSESGQLLAIAGLLVYPEAVLFFQRKNLRVYEQLAVFLLLEMIVAALVNDNLLFGLLLSPIMMLWVSSLFLFSRYATLVQIDPSIETPVPILAEILYKRFMKSVVGEPRRQNIVTSVSSIHDVAVNSALRRTLQSFPIGAGAIAFAAFFFYLLPRTAPSEMSPSLGFEPRVGLPKTLNIGVVGRLLNDPTPVMRVSLTHAESGQPYELLQPPYLRARVMDTYGVNSRNTWSTQGEWIFGGIHEYRRLKTLDFLALPADTNRQIVNIEFDVKRRFAATLYACPPPYALEEEQSIRLSYDYFSMVMEENDPTKLPTGRSLVYTMGSAGFGEQTQLRVSPALIGTTNFSNSRNLYSLPRDFGEFSRVDNYRREILEQARVQSDDLFGSAAAIEGHLTTGPFSYTLDLRPPIDADIDPMEDFLLNQRRGHCQYFAAAMTVMLRQCGIPARIVVGYRPIEFNSYGKYFPVRQSDAHAWVEALFSREDLVGTSLEKWLTGEESFWVRFDPTPSAEGGAVSIIQQQGQAIDYAEKLWKDYVVEGQKLAGQGSLYAPVAANSKDAYDQLVESLTNLKQNLQDGRFFSVRSGIAFEWQITILIVFFGFMLIVLWRLVLLLPTLAPRLARRLGIMQSEPLVRQDFFARCLKLLQSRGFKRASDETPREFIDRASQALVAKDADPARPLSESLNFVTSVYYRLRFGLPGSVSPEESHSIGTTLEQLENATTKK